MAGLNRWPVLIVITSLVLVILMLMTMDEFVRTPKRLIRCTVSNQCESNPMDEVESVSTVDSTLLTSPSEEGRLGVQLENPAFETRPPESDGARNPWRELKRTMTQKSAPTKAVSSQGTEPMVLSIDYWEQTANALQNLFDLQCWAKTVGINKVVEPSIKIFGTGVFHIVYNGKGFAFRDLFDVGHWNSMSQRYGSAPLVTFQHFLEHAARNIVHVQVTCGLQEQNVRCDQLSAIKNSNWAKFLRSRGFRFIKNVCFDFLTKTSMSEEAFRRKIFEGTDNHVTVIFDEFKGIRQYGKPVRMILTGPKCKACVNKLLNFDPSKSNTRVPIEYRPSNSSSQIVSSRRIINFANRFIKEHLSGKRYIAVMLRTEKLRTILRSTPDNNTCARNVISDVKKLMARKNIDKVLFFSDIGRHGSFGWRKDRTASRFSAHIHNALDLEFSLDEVNSIFENMTKSKDSVQIALLQRQLVTHATCIVVVGGGIFQAQALNMYFHKHRGHECYSYRDEQCRSTFIERIYGV